MLLFDIIGDSLQYLDESEKVTIIYLEYLLLLSLFAFKLLIINCCLF